jgi:hypothetical protein
LIDKSAEPRRKIAFLNALKIYAAILTALAEHRPTSARTEALPTHVALTRSDGPGALNSPFQGTKQDAGHLGGTTDSICTPTGAALLTGRNSQSAHESGFHTTRKRKSQEAAEVAPNLRCRFSNTVFLNP